MEGYIVWFSNGNSVHVNDIKTVQQMIKEQEVKTVTIEIYDHERYLGEYDISAKEFLETMI